MYLVLLLPICSAVHASVDRLKYTLELAGCSNDYESGAAVMEALADDVGYELDFFFFFLLYWNNPSRPRPLPTPSFHHAIPTSYYPYIAKMIVLSPSDKPMSTVELLVIKTIYLWRTSCRLSRVPEPFPSGRDWVQ